MVEGKVIRKGTLVQAPIQDVWDCWTTKEGVRSFFAPEARIDLRVGGAYEMYFLLDAPEGFRGGEGCILIEIRPPERLVFTWNFPPTIPDLREARAHTRVELSLRSLAEGKTELSLVQSGWKGGPLWEQGVEYFNRAWDVVLDRLKGRFEEGPVDWAG